MTELALPIGPCEPAGPAAELARLMTESGARRYGGILLCPLGEESEWLIAPGHVPPDVLADAVAEYAIAEGWWPGEATLDDRPDLSGLPGRTGRHMATVTTRGRDSADCECDDCLTLATTEADWYVQWSDGGTVPITVVDWE